MEQLVARWAHNPEVGGSSPPPATIMVPWCSWLTRLPVTQKIAGSSPVGTAIIFFGSVAQSVEQGTENPCVAGSIPAGATIFNLYIHETCLTFEKVCEGYALVAQLDRVFGYEPKGQGFESLRAHHILSGSSTTWQCTWFGTMRLQVQILSSRPFSNQTDFIVCFFVPKHLSNLPDLLLLKLF